MGVCLFWKGLIVYPICGAAPGVTPAAHHLVNVISPVISALSQSYK